jgi:hypothetical protein
MGMYLLTDRIQHHKMNTARSDFFASSKSEEKRYYMIKWEALAAVPKEFVGLGFTDTNGQWRWRGPCCDLLRKKYMGIDGFLSRKN